MFKIILVSLAFATLASAENVPVLTFGKSLPFRAPALQSVKTEEFSNLIRSLIDEDTVTVVFVENKLSIEDLTQCKTAEGVTCFKHLSTASQKSYFPNVDNAVDGLYDNLDANSVAISENEDISTVVDSGKRTIFVNLASASNSNDFLAHDKLIGETFATLSKKHTNLLFIYTGLASNAEAIVRKKRDTATPVKAATPLKSSNGPIDKPPVPCTNFLMAVKDIIKKDTDGEPQSIPLTSCSSDMKDKILTVTLQPVNLQLVFGNYAGTWGLKQAMYANNPLIMPAAIYANEGFAYRCGGDLTFVNSQTKISLINSQTMVSFKGNPTFNLKKIVHCEGFWSAGILAGLFVVLILLIILSYGLSWIMDINTMDKFDDPKGKSITINAGE